MDLQKNILTTCRLFIQMKCIPITYKCTDPVEALVRIKVPSLLVHAHK